MPEVDVKYSQLFIDNEFLDAEGGETFGTINPYTEEEICRVAFASESDVDNAVQAAVRAFHRNSEWRRMDASRRGVLINKLADLMTRDREQLASLDTMDNGKPYVNALGDIDFSIGVFRYYAGFADKIHGMTIPSDGSVNTFLRKEPVGVVGQIIPWNYPVAMVSWKWAPALATGCTLVLKPAEQTPLSALYMAQLAKEVGFPKGVINVVTGDGPKTGAAVARHPLIDKVAFTGSTQVGKIVSSLAANSNLKRVSLELGGKSPLVVMEDCSSVDKAVEICHEAIFGNHGQNCCAGSRTYVQSGIYDEFVKKATEMAAKRKFGSPWEEGVQQGPQVSKEQLEVILGYIKSGQDDGATLEVGGKGTDSKGYFVEPTVFSGVQDNMKIAKEEIFGPVQSIFKFDTLEEVIDRANATKYGLAAGIISENINNVMTYAQSVRAGSVWVNCYDQVAAQAPFGGFKVSGQGRELGAEGLEEYLECKTISISVPYKLS